jgi:hypothetical protein
MGMKREYIHYLKTPQEPTRVVHFAADHDTRVTVARILRTAGFDFRPGFSPVSELSAGTLIMVRPAIASVPFGCVVLTEAGEFGWALCKPGVDHFNYARAKQIAFGRARCKRNKPYVLSTAMARLIAVEKAKAFEWLEKQPAPEMDASEPDPEHHTVSREMALDAGDPSLEGQPV